MPLVMRFKQATKRPWLTVLVIMGAVASSAARPRAAHAAGAGTIDLSGIQALRRAHQIGLLVIGSEDAAGRTARALVKQQLEKADHEVRVLAAVSQPPPRALLAHTCLTLGIDAIALVRISTPGSSPKSGG